MPHSGVPHWSIVSRHEEDEVRTKTGAFDESIVFNPKFHEFFLPTLRWLKASGRDESPLWPFSIKFLNELLRQACIALGLQDLKVELYSFRHGGASRDIVSGDRDLVTVKEILRHASDLTVRRYEKSGDWR
jgi:integrase